MQKYTKPYPTIGDIIDTEYFTDEKFEKYLEEWKKTREKYNI